MIPIKIKNEQGEEIIINKKYIVSIIPADYNWKGENKIRTIITMIDGYKIAVNENIEKISEILKLF